MKSSKYNIHKIFGKVIPMGLILFGVSSCAVSQDTARENDGIYYDPSSAPVEETVYQNQPNPTAPTEQPVQIGGKYFNEYGDAPTATESETYPEEQVYEENSYASYENNDSYEYWGEDEGVQIEVNNYYSPYAYNGWYRPFRPYGFYGYPRFSLSFGWNSWGYHPFYPSYYGFSPYYSGFYGPYNPYFSPYSPYYSPYYGPYYSNHYYGHNGFYRNPYIRDVYRGRGNTNGVRRQVSNNNRNKSVRRESQRVEQPSRRGEVRPTNNATSNVRTKSTEVRNGGNDSPVRIRPRRRVSGERSNKSGVNSDVQIRTPRKRSTRVRSTQPNRTSTPTIKAPRRRTKSPSTYQTPTRTKSSNSSIRTSPSRSNSSMGTSRSSSTSRSSRGVRRR